MFLNSSIYYEKVKKFIEKFGNEQVKIIIFEEFIENPSKKFQEILDFLEIKSKLPVTLNEKFGEYTQAKSNIGNYLLKNDSIIKFSRIIPQTIRWKLKRSSLNLGNSLSFYDS